MILPLLLRKLIVTNGEIPLVDIVHLVHSSSSTLAHDLEPHSLSSSTHQKHETLKKSLATTTLETAIANLSTHLYEVHCIPFSEFDNTLFTLISSRKCCAISVTYYGRYSIIIYQLILSLFSPLTINIFILNRRFRLLMEK